MIRSGVVVLIAVAGSSAVAAPVAFDPTQAAPYFSSGTALAARDRFRLEAWADAARMFGDYLRANPRTADRHQAEFLAAYATSRAGHFDEAARRFDELGKSYPLLLDYHRIYAARAYLAAKQPETALARASDVASSSPIDGDARFVRADALRQLARAAEAEREYRGYVERFSGGWREPEARWRIAELVVADPARWSEARTEYITLLTRWPTDTWGQKAAERMRAREPKLKLAGAEHLTRGLALFESMRNAESEAELRLAVAAGDLDPVKQCVAAYHVAQSVFKARDRPRAAALFDAAAAVCAKGPASDGTVQDLHMKSLYQSGRCHAARGEAEQAVQLFARAEREHPKHSYADDARLRQAEVLDGAAEKLAKARADKQPLPALITVPPTDGGKPTALGDPAARAASLLGDLADRYPAGDVRSEALFRLFFRAWRAGKLDDADRWLGVALVKVPREEGWWDQGRTLYWQGRVAQRKGKLDVAQTAWLRCVREYPLAYYSLAAWNRLREGWPDVTQKLLQELHPPVVEVDLGWSFAPRELFGNPGFLRGVELARLGMGVDARREFAVLGIRPPEGLAAKTHKVEPGSEAEELLWLATVLYDRAGQFATSHWIPRHTLTTYSLKWPVADNRKRWLLSYPRGYAELLIEHAQKNGQPPALQFAIVREESAFDPLTESFANAIGLTQLTAPPAHRWAQGLPTTREALRDPVINVTIGARELGFLWGFFHESAPLAIAGYNAGEGAVMRWYRAAPANQPLDEFIESIPYDETRGYTKRVLSSYFTYRWLYDDGDPVPPLPLAMPHPGK